MLAWYWYTQAAVFSFRNTNVLNQGFRKGDRGALATYKHDSRAVGDPCDTDTTRYNITMGPTKPTASSNTLMQVLLGGAHGWIAPIPSTTPRTWTLLCPSRIPLQPLHPHRGCSLPSQLQESHQSQHPYPCTLSTWLLENTDGGHPEPTLQPQGTGLNLHTRKPRKMTPSTTSTPHLTAPCPPNYHHYTCTHS